MKYLLLFTLSCLLAAASISSPHSEHLPSIYFLPNSALPRTDSIWYQQYEHANSVEEIIDTVVKILTDNPEVVIATVGFCDYREEDRSVLALARANKVRDMLIDKGVGAHQVEAQGRAEHFTISKEEMVKMKDPEEREAAHAHNRFVTFHVLRSDRKQ